MFRRFLRPAETWLAVKAPRARSPMRNATAPESSGSTGVSMESSGSGTLTATARSLARLVGFVVGLEIGPPRGVPHPRDVLGHVPPGRAEVCQAARRAAGL